MKKCLIVLLNMTFKKELELLYGKGSIVEVNDVKYCTNTKNFTIDCTLKVADINLFNESNIDGLKYLVEESWRFTGFEKDNLSLVATFDVID